jgi:DnaJ-class molecular chaperone
MGKSVTFGPCRACKGTGTKKGKTCASCGGSGKERYGA